MIGTVDNLLSVADEFCRARGLSEARLSTLLFNDGKRLGLLRAGRDVGSRKLPHLFEWLSEHWPDDGRWPDGIPRPDPASIISSSTPAHDTKVAAS